MNTTAAKLATNSTPSVRSTLDARRSTLFSLRRGLGFWELTFAGERAIFKHEQGANYVAYLLLNPPPQPIHGLALALKIKAPRAMPCPATEILDPATGEALVIANDAVVQERHLRLDHAEAARNLRRTLRQLDGIMEDRNEREAVKSELHAEIERIEEFQRKHMRRVEDEAQKAVRAVRRAMTRFHAHLAASNDSALHSFATHLHKYILIPSSRFATVQNSCARVGLAGCFMYEAPTGILWSK